MGLRAVGSPPGPQFVLAASAAGASDFVSPSASTTGVKTSGLGINFIVVAANQYAPVVADLSVADTINGNPSGNVWALVMPAAPSSFFGGVNGQPALFYCYAPNVGTNHVFTLTTTNSDFCPRIAVQAFKGMPSTGVNETASGWYGIGGNTGPMPSAQYSLGLMSPNNLGDLVISAFGGGLTQSPAVVTVDCGLTITTSIIGLSGFPSLFGITAGYLVATTPPAQTCTGDVVINGDGTVTIGVESTVGFVSPVTCTGNVVITGAIIVIDVDSSAGFTPGMSVDLNGFLSLSLGSFVYNVVSTTPTSVTVVFFGSFSAGTHTGQTGTVSQNVTLAGFSGELVGLNNAVQAYVLSVGTGVVTLGSGLVSPSTNPGTYTGQAGAVGVPVNPFWSWGGTLSNAGGAGMVIFPGDAS